MLVHEKERYNEFIVIITRKRSNAVLWHHQTQEGLDAGGGGGADGGVGASRRRWSLSDGSPGTTWKTGDDCLQVVCLELIPRMYFLK